MSRWFLCHYTNNSCALFQKWKTYSTNYISSSRLLQASTIRMNRCLLIRTLCWNRVLCIQLVNEQLTMSFSTTLIYHCSSYVPNCVVYFLLPLEYGSHDFLFGVVLNFFNNNLFPKSEFRSLIWMIEARDNVIRRLHNLMRICKNERRLNNYIGWFITTTFTMASFITTSFTTTKFTTASFSSFITTST